MASLFKLIGYTQEYQYCNIVTILQDCNPDGFLVGFNDGLLNEYEVDKRDGDINGKSDGNSLFAIVASLL